jgi:hypothetical protein
MQPTTRLHDGITYPVLQQAELLFHHPIALYTANRMFNPHADGRETTILHLLCWGEFTSTGFLLGLTTRDPREQEALQALLLIQTAAGWPRRARQLRQALLRRFARRGMAQEAHGTHFMHHQEVLERGALFLATVILLRFLRGFRPGDGPCSTLMPTRGDVPPAVDCVAARSAANSSAVRAGRRSW